MPGVSLPTLIATDVASHNTSKSCYVTIGTKVFDVTTFLEDHPGGGELITEYGGKDVTEIMGDEISHSHSEAAYEILDDHLIGFLPTEGVINAATKAPATEDVLPLPANANGQAILQNVQTGTDSNGRPVYAATGIASEEDLSKETDVNEDYKTHRFLDLNKPLLMQVFRGGFEKDFYLEQVHRPRHYKGGASAPLFEWEFLEPLSKTAWYVVPSIWLPCIAYGTYLAKEGFSSWAAVVPFWVLGLFIWTLVEYVLHRCLFHLDYYLPNNRFAITAHFLLHGIHHYLPMDKLRLVMPPTLFVALAIPFWKLAHTLFWNWYMGTAVFSGGIFGYVCYDCTHYFLHHRR
jgi:4-hydroxysphinganine ceramide fatty acyl 2-hydroxylase